MWTINKTKNWNELNRFSWIKDMQDVPQSKVHHAEGDVATHTRMVIQSLENSAGFQALENEQQEIVWAAALMHDIEKRSTTFTDEDGNIVSPGHAKKGAMTARQILYRDIATPFAIREQVVALVRHHGLPLWLFEKQQPAQTLLKASLEVDTKLLAMLATADVLGRVCSDAKELLYKIQLFEEYCKEHDCWGKPGHFPGKLARFQYFRKEDRQPDYEPFDDYKGEVIMLSGIAGSGKDFYIRQHFHGYQVVSLDDLRRKSGIRYNDSKGNGQIIQQAKELAKAYLRKGTPFVWNATNITSQMRAQLIELFDSYKAKVTIIYIEIAYSTLLAQNNNREHPIPETAVEKMIDKLEVPKLWESYDVQYIV